MTSFSRRQIIRLAAGAGVGLATLPAALSGARLDLPFDGETLSFSRDEEGRAMVPVKLVLPDERQFSLWFMFDTGADQTSLFDIATSALDMQPLDFRSQRVMLATGPVEAFVFQTKHVAALGNQLDDFRIVGVPGRGSRGRAVGILGTDLMFRRNLLFDWQADQFSFWAKDRVPEGYQWISARRVMSRSINVPLFIGDLEIPALVDSGATHSVLNLPAVNRLADQGAIKRRDTDRDLTRLFAGWATTDAETVDVPDLKIGDSKSPGRLTLTDQPMLGAQLPVFNFLGARKVPAAIIGMDILTQQNVIFDFQQGQLWV